MRFRGDGGIVAVSRLQEYLNKQKYYALAAAAAAVAVQHDPLLHKARQ